MANKAKRAPGAARARVAKRAEPVAGKRGAPGGAARAASTPRKRRAAVDLMVVDVGNSETVAGMFHGEELRGFWRLVSRISTADEIGLQLDALIQRLARAQHDRPFLPRAAVFGSVAPSLTLVWAKALEQLTGTPALEVNAANAKSLTIRYHDRNAVGADRIANAIAVRALYGTPAIVVDLGTATTFDCVSRAGTYLGGVIAPGIGTSIEELHRRAARLPRVELRKPARALGRTTEESMQAGAVWGTAGQVDALVRRLALEMQGTPHVIATGGWASVIASECETINRVDETLTLKGLRLLWEEQR